MPANEVKPAQGEWPAASGAAAGGAEKRAYVQRMFSQIAPRYDLLNRVLSGRLDAGWRRRALAGLGWTRRPEGSYLDVCAGTLDVSAALARAPGFRGVVLGADFAEPMLRAGRGKVPADVVSPLVADAVELPLRSDSVAGAIVAFGIRNLADLPAGLREVFRVLQPGGRLVILEFSTPESVVVRTAYHAYFHHVLPLIGGLLSGHRTAYRYLPESVKSFPSKEGLAAELRRAGFTQVHWDSLTLGVVAIHAGDKP